MESLDWVDRTYISKHRSDDPKSLRAMYYPNLKMYKAAHTKTTEPGTKKSAFEAMGAVLYRFGKRAGISLAVYMASFLPLVGRFVLPAASFYTFDRAVGIQPAVAVFATAIVLPKRYLIVFLQTYFSSRTLMRELVGFPSCGSKNLPSASSCPTSLASSTPTLKRSSGSKTAKAFSLDLP